MKALHLLRTSLTLGLSFFLLSACNYKREKSAPESLNQADLDRALAQGLNWDTVNEFVFSPRCKDCHNSGNLQGDLDTTKYETVFASLSEIQLRVFTDKDMPPASQGPLTTTESEILKRWISAGAPRELGNTDTAPGTPDPTPTFSPTPPATPTPLPTPTMTPPIGIDPSFDSIKLGIFDPKCSKCHHSGPNSDGDLFMSQTQMIQDNLIKPGVAVDQNKLIRFIVPRPNNRPPRMPPADSSIPVVTPEELKIIETWILSL